MRFHRQIKHRLHQSAVKQGVQAEVSSIGRRRQRNLDRRLEFTAVGTAAFVDGFALALIAELGTSEQVMVQSE